MIGVACAAALALTGCDSITPAPIEYHDPDVARPAPNSVDAPSVAVAVNDAGYDIFHAVAANSDGDVVLSPISIGLAFGMLDLGASGSVADALDSLFRYPVAGDARWSAFNTLQQETVRDPGPTPTPTSTADVAPPRPPTVAIANRLFQDAGYPVVPAYAEGLQKWFGAGIEPFAIRSDPEAARLHINAWVKDQTLGLIPDLIPAGAIDSSTNLVLVNALYLKALWATPFISSATADGPFTRLDGSTATASFMHDSQLKVAAVVGDGYSAVDLPYAGGDLSDEGGDLSMLVVVPDAGNYAAIESDFGTDFVASVDASLERQTVDLALPRFESDSAINLRDVIENDLGIAGLFDTPGGLVGIGTPDLTVSNALHSAKIAIDEEGTEAAAATAIMMDSAFSPPKVAITVDRPFLYVIRDHSTGAVLFVGRVLDPSA
jgi:serpin B